MELATIHRIIEVVADTESEQARTVLMAIANLEDPSDIFSEDFPIDPLWNQTLFDDEIRPKACSISNVLLEDGATMMADWWSGLVDQIDAITGMLEGEED